MTLTFILGMIAAILTTIAFVPQVVKAARSKKTEDLSLLMFILFCSGVFLWMIYGILLNELPIILANGCGLTLGIYLIYLKIKYS